MRTKKRRGKQPPTVTLTEAEIVQACSKYVEDKGFKLSPMSYMKIFTGRTGKRSKVEVVMELQED